MDTIFYNLEHKPFTLNPDPSFLWLGENHKRIFTSLVSGIADSKGFLLLTGIAGSGKTALVMALIERLKDDVLCAVITDPRLERVDLYNAIGRGFGLDKKFSSKVQFLIHFSHFLHKAADKNKKVLLVVDNCHHLRQETLEELRLLAGIEKEDTRLMNIFFAGLPEFDDLLEKPRNRAVKQRLLYRAVLPSLDLDETSDYIRHRLKIAGTEEELLTTAAVQAVHRFSQGVPRLINILCNHALASGSIQGKQIINDKMIESCIGEMELPGASLRQKSRADSFYQKIITDGAQSVIGLWRLFGAKLLQGGRVTYGLGILVLIIAGIYFWFSAAPSFEANRFVPEKTAALLELEDSVQTSTLPPEPVPEEKKVGAEEEKSVPLQTTIRIRPLVIKEKRDSQAPVR